jgi:hypothetical protein
MRTTFGQIQEQTAGRPAPNGAAVITPTVKEIPYDYVARFALEGRRARRVQDVINISTDGAFVAVAVGYSFIPAPPKPPPDDGEDDDGGIDIFSGNVVAALLGDDPRLQQAYLAQLCGISFKYSIIDSGSGRELQNQPIHNIAGLGEPNGNRPFRPMAKPMLFAPRSTIRIEIEEISEGDLYGYDENNIRRGSELYIVLHGYKILGYGA